MTAAPTSRLVSIEEAARIVGVTRRSIHRWIAEGKLRCRRTVGGCVRIEEASLWQDEARPTPAPAALERTAHV
jgi:excisionase family DNA binding protein